MNTERWQQLFTQHFPFEPTRGQAEVMHALARLMSSDKPRCTLLIKGYAGTGKTTLVGAVVRALKEAKQGCVLLAPTGRAAKVMSLYSGQSAHTIHKKIYHLKYKRDGGMGFELAPNLHKDTLFIVDEASMIGSKGLADTAAFQYRDLLQDLIAYCFNGKDCRLILIGDDAQLPPVGSDESPALDTKALASRYGLTAAALELTEVLRQEKESGILFNATALRDQIRRKLFEFPQFKLEGFNDIKRINGQELQEELESCYQEFGPEGVCIITRSNKRANLFNLQVRSRVFWQEDLPEAGDLFMVVRNNYLWLSDIKDSPTEFIANGDTAAVEKIIRRYELYDLQFADVQLRLVDYPQLGAFEARVLLDTLTDEGPSLNQGRMKALYEGVSESYLDLMDKQKIREAVSKDPWYNALQVKFAYAVTCHKAQGGQWSAVIIDQGYLTEEHINLEFLRWLYTAITRSTKKLYLLNFSPEFFGEVD